MQEIILKLELIRMESIIGIVNEGDSLSHRISISLYPVNSIAEQSKDKSNIYSTRKADRCYK